MTVNAVKEKQASKQAKTRKEYGTNILKNMAKPLSGLAKGVATAHTKACDLIRNSGEEGAMVAPIIYPVALAGGATVGLGKGTLELAKSSYKGSKNLYKKTNVSESVQNAGKTVGKGLKKTATVAAEKFKQIKDSKTVASAITGLAIGVGVAIIL
jgi:hypothetical protein